MEDDIADLLDEGEFKQPKIKPVSSNTGNSFLNLIKNNAKKVFDSPIQSNEQKPVTIKETSQFNKQRESFASSDDGVYVPDFTGKIVHEDAPVNKVEQQTLQNKISSMSVNPEKKDNIVIPSIMSNNDNIKQFQNQIDEMKKNYEAKLDEQKKDYEKQIEIIRSNHSNEIASMKSVYEEKEKLLNQEIERLKNESSSLLQNERDRLNSLHQEELSVKEEKHKKELQDKDNYYKGQIEEVKKQTKQQNELNILTKKFEASSRQIEELAAKLEKANEKTLRVNQDALIEKEIKLQSKEERLKETERNILVEKELLLKEKQEMELKETQRKKEIQNEKMKIEKEIIRLQQLQNTLKSLEYQSKEKHDKDSMALSYKENEMKMEIDNLMNNYNTKKSELDYNIKMFEQEKKFFEKFKEDAFKNIEIQKVNIEERKKKLVQDEEKFKEKLTILQQKEFYVTEHADYFNKMDSQFKQKQIELSEKENDLALAAKRIEDEINALERRETELQIERENIERLYQEIENEKIIINSEKMKIEQDKTDMKLRLQTVDNLRIKYVNTNMNNSNGIVNTDKTVIEEAVELNKTLKQFNKANTSFITTEPVRLNQSTFNSDDYFNTLKNKLNQIKYEPKGNGVGLSSYLLKEHEYLKKSNEDLENKLKNTYDILNKNSQGIK